MQAGSTGRYFLDFAWMFVLAGIMIFMEMYERYKSEESKIILSKVFTGIACFTLVINLLLGFCDIGVNNSMKAKSPDMYYKVAYGVCFYK